MRRRRSTINIISRTDEEIFEEVKRRMMARIAKLERHRKQKGDSVSAANAASCRCSESVDDVGILSADDFFA